MANDANLIGNATRNGINSMIDKREFEIKLKMANERKMSLIFNMFKYANPLKRAGVKAKNKTRTKKK